MTDPIPLTVPFFFMIDRSLPLISVCAVTKKSKFLNTRGSLLFVTGSTAIFPMGFL